MTNSTLGFTRKELYTRERRDVSSHAKTKYLWGIAKRVRGTKVVFILYKQWTPVRDLGFRYKCHYTIRFAVAADDRRLFSGIIKSWFT